MDVEPTSRPFYDHPPSVAQLADIETELREQRARWIRAEEHLKKSIFTLDNVFSGPFLETQSNVESLLKAVEALEFAASLCPTFAFGIVSQALGIVKTALLVAVREYFLPLSLL